MKKLFLPIFFICISFFFHSCSRLDFAVQLASTYVASKADDYFDLTHDQTKWLKVNFEKDFERVQKIIFPQIAGELMKASETISNNRPVDATTVMMSYERIKNLFYDGMRMFAANAVIFADKLHPNQIVYFQKEFDKKMRDIKDDGSSKDAYKKMKKQFDSWMGSMTSIQKKELEDFSMAYPPITSEKIYNRQLLAHEFVTSYPDRTLRKRFIEKLMTQFDLVYEAKFSKAAKDRNNKTIVVVASILNKMTDDQRKTLSETLRDRANQLIKISKN